MSAPRAYEVRRGDTLCGVLRAGGGPFVTATRSALPAPVLEHASYTSRDPYSEAEISRILVDARDFEAARAALAAAGLELRLEATR